VAATTAPPPLPTAGLGSTRTPCPTLMTPSAVTATPPKTTRPATKSPTSDPNVTTFPDGHTVRQVCALAPPVPFVGPVIAAEHTVGGPALAREGVITDLPADLAGPPEMPHVSYVLAELTTGEVLAAKAPHALLRPASTLKTLTALVVMPRLSPSQVVVGAPEDAAADGGRAGIVPGNPYTVDDLLNGLLLASGNDTAYALARAYGGRDRLLADMNSTAARLGAYDTHALDPSGLDADGQRSSAYDLALIGRAAMRLPDFRRRVALLSATFPGATLATTKTMAAYQIQNRNPIIEGYPGAVGIKSGWTSHAGNTLIAAATRDGRTLLLAEMGSVERQTEPTKALLDWGFAAAGRARPVGRLVDPGTTPQPPEWAAAGGTAAPLVTLSEPTLSSPDESAATSEGARPSAPLTAAGSPSGTVEPIEYAVAASVSRWWTGLPVAARWAIAVLVVGGLALLGWRLLRWWRALPRGAHS